MPYWIIIVWLIVGGSVGYIGRDFLAQHVGAHSLLGSKKDVIIAVIAAFFGGYFLAILSGGGFFGSVITIVGAAAAAAASLRYNHYLKRYLA